MAICKKKIFQSFLKAFLGFVPAEALK